MITLFDNDTDCTLPAEFEHSAVERWSRIFSAQPSCGCIENSSARPGILHLGSTVLPLFLSRARDCEQTWVTSQYTHYVKYAREEAGKIPSGFIRSLIHPITTVLDLWAKWIRLDDALYLNNFGLSTNLWPDLPTMDVVETVKECLRYHPDKTIILRSLNAQANADHISGLREHGFLLVPSRITYVLPVYPLPRKRNFRCDEKLFNDGMYRVRQVHTLSASELHRCMELYRMLYIMKYSKHNAQYSEHFFKTALATRFLDFTVLERNGVIDGVIGTFTHNNILTCPILGYDLSTPRALGLYRRLSMAIYHDAVSKGCSLINQSSGVGRFKQSRGAVPVTEFTAVYVRHMPRKTRAFWHLLSTLCDHFIAPMVKRLEL